MIDTEFRQPDILESKHEHLHYVVAVWDKNSSVETREQLEQKLKYEVAHERFLLAVFMQII